MRTPASPLHKFRLLFHHTQHTHVIRDFFHETYCHFRVVLLDGAVCSFIVSERFFVSGCRVHNVLGSSRDSLDSS